MNIEQNTSLLQKLISEFTYERRAVLIKRRVKTQLSFQAIHPLFKCPLNKHLLFSPA